MSPQTWTAVYTIYYTLILLQHRNEISFILQEYS